MALKLDNELLRSLGLDRLRPETKRELLQHIYRTLELRVGYALASMMSDEQLAEFERMLDTRDSDGDSERLHLAWLQANVPFYKDVVERTFEEIKSEIENRAPDIVAGDRAAFGGAA